MMKSIKQNKKIQNILKRKGLSKKGAIADSLGFFISFLFMIFVILIFLLIAKLLTSPVTSTILGKTVIDSQLISREELTKFAQTDTTLLNYVRSPVIFDGKEKTVADIINDVVHKDRAGILKLNLVFESFKQAGFLQSTSILFDRVQKVFEDMYSGGYDLALKTETKQILDAAYTDGGKWALFVTKPDGTLIFYQFSDNANSNDKLYFYNALADLSGFPNQLSGSQKADLNYAITYSSIVLPIKETNKDKAQTVRVCLMSTNLKPIPRVLT